MTTMWNRTTRLLGMTASQPGAGNDIQLTDQVGANRRVDLDHAARDHCQPGCAQTDQLILLLTRTGSRRSATLLSAEGVGCSMSCKVVLAGLRDLARVISQIN
jgi:hypothetical protein